MPHLARRTTMMLLCAAALLAGTSDCGHRHHPVTPLEPQYGTLVVGSDPAGATILVDGRDYGSVTPDDFTLPSGPHRVTVALAGHAFSPSDTTLTVPAEGTVSYTFLEYAAHLVPASAVHDFGAQALGSTGASWCVEVTNAGRAPADSGAFTLAGADSGAFVVVSGGTYRALAPGASQQVCVAFKPARKGAAHTSLRVGAGAIALTGTGYKVPCALAPGAASHDFGTQDVGASYPDWCFTITNDDAAACADTLQLAGAGAGEFAIVSGAAYDLAPGASQDVCVRFVPAGNGPRTASLVVGTTAVTLSGTGSGHCLLSAPATPDGTDFGTTCADASTAKRLVMTNTGNLACTVTATGCGPFAVSPASAPVPAGGSATFTVAWQPSSAGAAPDCPVVLSDGTQQWPVTFTGTGTSVPVADFSPTGGVVAHAGVPVAFVPHVQDNGSAVTAYAWDFGDGATSTQVQPSHRYAAGGSYTVTLTVTNACGSSPPNGHTLCIDEPAYVQLYHFDGSITPDYVTNIPGWGTSVPLVLYRGGNAGYGTLASVVCANVFTGEHLDTGFDHIAGVNKGASEALGTSGQTFATARLPLDASECSVTTDLTIGTVTWANSAPSLYLKVGACNHVAMGVVNGDPRFCNDYFNTSHCTLTGGDGRLEWGLEPLAQVRWSEVNAVKFTFDCWYVCPQSGPRSGPLRVVDAPGAGARVAPSPRAVR